uniref:Uncharacterized protein n=1 Tax=Ananas comosus var. bracteatus TaxID=296719 RepID=A0A6V7P977_ANACO|nr:unnamed protein product [Ananas comosus var. bracteatus]
MAHIPRIEAWSLVWSLFGRRPSTLAHPKPCLELLERVFGAQLIGLEPLSRLRWKGFSSPLELVRDFHHYRELGSLWASSSAQTKVAWNSRWVWPHQNGINHPYDGFYFP